MGVDTIQISLVKTVDAVKLKVGVPNRQIKLRECFGWDDFGQLVDFILGYIKSDFDVVKTIFCLGLCWLAQG